jgi:hypothetical protein
VYATLFQKLDSFRHCSVCLGLTVRFLASFTSCKGRCAWGTSHLTTVNTLLKLFFETLTDENNSYNKFYTPKKLLNSLHYNKPVFSRTSACGGRVLFERYSVPISAGSPDILRFCVVLLRIKIPSDKPRLPPSIYFLLAIQCHFPRTFDATKLLQMKLHR